MRRTSPPALLLALLLALAPAAAARAASDGGAGELARSFLTALFERRYEDAHALTDGKSPEERAFARYDAWAGRFMSPTDLKVLRVKPEAGGALAVLTFKYKTPAGVDAIERAELRLSGSPGSYKIEGLKGRGREAPAPAAGGASAWGGAPVTIPENPPPFAPAGGGSLLGAAQGLLGGLSGGGDGAKLQELANFGPIAQIMADPQVVALAADPRVQAIANDPRILGAIMSGNLDAVMKDPRLLQLANDPKFKSVLEKFAGGGDAGGGGSEDFNGLIDLLGK